VEKLTPLGIKEQMIKGMKESRGDMQLLCGRGDADACSALFYMDRAIREIELESLRERRRVARGTRP